jgi:hypothetical protein
MPRYFGYWQFLSRAEFRGCQVSSRGLLAHQVRGTAIVWNSVSFVDMLPDRPVWQSRRLAGSVSHESRGASAVGAPQRSPARKRCEKLGQPMPQIPVDRPAPAKILGCQPSQPSSWRRASAVTEDVSPGRPSNELHQDAHASAPLVHCGFAG